MRLNEKDEISFDEIPSWDIAAAGIIAEGKNK
jgi:hypothetical protein